MDSCDWRNPGGDRYIGTIPAAIIAYGLPQATQAALIAAWERRDFTDQVLIDRDEIRGRHHAYEPTIKAMHFGSRGRICRTVTRSSWPADRAESAVVLCADAECVAIAAVCSNVFRITRLAARPVDDEVGLVVVAGGEEMTGIPIDPADPETDPGPTAETDDPTFFGGSGAPHWPAFGMPSALPPGWLTPRVPAPVAAIPEPSAWLLAVLGLACIVARRSVA